MDPPGHQAPGRPSVDPESTEIEDTALAEHAPARPTIRERPGAARATPPANARARVDSPASARGTLGVVLALVGVLAIAAVVIAWREHGSRPASAAVQRAPTNNARELRLDIAATIRESLARIDDARRLCGFEISRVSDIDVHVTATSGTLATGSGRADVSALGTPSSGGGGQPQRCQASMTFRYEASATASNVLLEHLFHPLSVGSAVTGTLTLADERTADDRRADEYALDLAEGQTVTLVARGGPSSSDPAHEIDVDLFAMYDGRTVDDDDGAGDLDARLVLEAPHAGTHFIVVSTASGATTGEYTLAVVAGVDARSLPATSDASTP